MSRAERFTRLPIPTLNRSGRSQSLAPLYPFVGSFSLIGLAIGVALLVALQSFAVAAGAALLFVIIAFTWRSDIPPIFPFCFAYQWAGAYVGAIHFLVYGFYPGGGNTDGLNEMLWASALGFAGLALGVRFGMRIYGKKLRQILTKPDPIYDINRLSALVIVLFSVYFTYDVSPKGLWFGGAQIIENLLSIRFIPYFILVLVSIDQGRYSRLALITCIVLLPQLLTGFSDFKELFFILFVCLLYQWRPWSKREKEEIRNARILLIATLVAALIVVLGLIWSGGLKEQWRQKIWGEDVLATSPMERMGLFFDVAGEVSSNFDLDESTHNLAARLSSGGLYFSYVLQRVPEIVPHERGLLAARAVENATVPRFLFPQKVNLGGDSWLVRQYAGIEVAGDESGTSIGLGYMPEFYIDFGYIGVLSLCFVYGMILIACLRLFAWAAMTKLIFIAMSLSLLMDYFTVFDASFAKLLAGTILRTIILSVSVAILAPNVLPWLGRASMRRSRVTHRGRPKDKAHVNA